MFTAYVQGAMRQSTYEQLEDGMWYGEIPLLQGVWSRGETPDGCRENLQDALEGWLVLGLRRNASFPEIDGNDLSFTEEVLEDIVEA